MRILFLSMEYPPETGGGGIGSYVASVAPALVACGHEVHVLSCVSGQEARDYQDQGVWIHRRNQRRLRGLGRLLRSSEATARLRVALSAYFEFRLLGVHFDVVEFPDWMAEGLAVSLARPLPLVAHLHTPLHVICKYNMRPFHRARRLGDLLERTAVRRADFVTAPSHLIAAELERSGWVGDVPLEVIPYPVDLDRWEGVPGPERTRPAVLAVGRLERLKAPEVLVQAAARLSSELPDVEVVFVGRDGCAGNGMSYGEYIRLLAAGLGVRTRLVGQVPRNDLRAWYARARVVAIPSFYENFPMAALEGMASGRPVVCTTRAGVAEILQHGGGRVVPPGDPDALAHALRPYLLDPVYARAEGRRAREIVKANCHPAVVAQRREAVYLAAIERHEQRLARDAGWFRYAAPRLSKAAPAWHRLVACEAARTPWKHFYLRTAEQVVDLLNKHPALTVLTQQSLKGLRILDLGCTPHVSLALAALGAHVTLLDIAWRELEKAGNLARCLDLQTHLNLVLADAFRPPFRSGSFDVVFNSGFIEHFDDPVGVIRIMAELTRPGGAVCVLAPARFTLHSLVVRDRQRRRGQYYWDYMGLERSYTPRELKEMLVQAGVRPLAHASGNLRRAFLDDVAVLPHLNRTVARRFLYLLINLVDALEFAVPRLRSLGFMAGVIGLRL